MSKRSARRFQILLWFVLALSRSYADQPITVPTTAYDRAAYTGNAIDKIARDRAYEKTYEAQIILLAYENNAAVDTSALRRDLDEIERNYQAQRKLAASTEGYQAFSHETLYQEEMFFEIASKSPYVGTYASIAKKRADERIYEINQELAPEAQITAQGQQYNLYSYLESSQQQIWGQIHDLAAHDPAAGAVIDERFAPYLNARTSDPGFRIFNNNPQFQESQLVKYIAQSVTPGATIVLDPNQLVGKYRQDMTKLGGDVSTSQKTLETYQKVRRQAAAAQKLRDAVARNQKERDRDLSAARAGLSIVTTFIPDKKLARDISVSGSVVISSIDAIGKYNDAIIQNKGRTDAASSILLTSNLLTGFTTLMTIFDDPKKSPDALIMEELRNLREEVIKLHQDMTYRFDRVDITLNQIYVGLLRNLARIEYDVGKLDGKLEDVQTSLLQLSAQLDHVEQAMFEYLTDLSVRMTNRSMTYCLEFSKLYAPATLDDEDYRRCQADFLTWAVSDSRDRLAAPLTNIYEADFSRLTRELPLPSKINLLAYIVSQVDPAYGLPARRLANPLVWATGAQAYVEMAQQYPAYFKKYPPEGLRRLIETGEDLDRFLAAMTLKRAGSQITANRRPIDELIDNYRAAALALASDMEQMQKEFIEHTAKSISLWGDADQKTDYVPTQLSTPIETVVGGTKTHLSLSPDIRTLLPNCVLNAEKLGLGSATFSLDFSIVDISIRSGPKIRGNDSFSEYGHLRTTLTVKFDDRIVLRRGFDTGEYPICFVGAGQRCVGPDLDTGISSGVNSFYSAKADIYHSMVSKSFDLSGADAPEIGKSVVSVREKVTKQIHTLRRENSGTLLAAFSRSDALATRSQRLNGAVDMVDLYVSYVLPQSVTENDELRGLLFGDKRIVDGDLIQTSLAHAPERSPLPGLRSDINTRSRALNRSIRNILAALGEQRKHELQPLIETTLMRLNQAAAIHGNSGGGLR